MLNTISSITTIACELYGLINTSGEAFPIWNYTVLMMLFHIRLEHIN